jgi:hypothetical protein
LCLMASTGVGPLGALGVRLAIDEGGSYASCRAAAMAARIVV